MGRTKVEQSLKGGKKQRKPRKPKDKDAPKRPCTAFFFYVKENRSNPDCKSMSVAAFTKMCGEKWRALSKDDKKPFFDDAAIDKERYNKAMSIYNKSKGKDDTKPKKPMTAFLLFVAKNRPKIFEEVKNQTLVLGRAGELWKSMSEAEKRPYQADAEKLKEAYDKKMKEWTAATKKGPIKKAPSKKEVKNGKESDDEMDDDDDEEDDDEEDDDEDDDDMESDDE